jgi:hypothetical protein
MKFLIATFVTEFQKEVNKIFKEAGITAYSSTGVTGYKNQTAPDLLGAWFASGEEKFDSVFAFSICGAQQAEECFQKINLFNSSTKTKFPVRAFILPVEKSNY